MRHSEFPLVIREDESFTQVQDVDLGFSVATDRQSDRLPARAVAGIKTGYCVGDLVENSVSDPFPRAVLIELSSKLHKAAATG